MNEEGSKKAAQAQRRADASDPDFDEVYGHAEQRDIIHRM